MDVNRTERVNVRVTAQELQKFEKLAKKRHTYLSELIRQLLHREADMPQAQKA